MLSVEQLAKGAQMLRTTRALVALSHLFLGWVETKAQLLLVREPPIEATSVISDEVNASRSKKWEPVGQERSRDSCASASLVSDEQ